MNTPKNYIGSCNYTTPYPISSHEEGGELYSNGVQVVTISSPYMRIQQDSVLGDTIMVLALIAGGVIVLGSVISYFIFRK